MLLCGGSTCLFCLLSLPHSLLLQGTSMLNYRLKSPSTSIILLLQASCVRIFSRVVNQYLKRCEDFQAILPVAVAIRWWTHSANVILHNWDDCLFVAVIHTGNLHGKHGWWIVLILEIDSSFRTKVGHSLTSHEKHNHKYLAFYLHSKRPLPTGRQAVNNTFIGFFWFRVPRRSRG